jgi:hypothetical protein
MLNRVYTTQHPLWKLESGWKRKNNLPRKGSRLRICPNFKNTNMILSDTTNLRNIRNYQCFSFLPRRKVPVHARQYTALSTLNQVLDSHEIWYGNCHWINMWSLLKKAFILITDCLLFGRIISITAFHYVPPEKRTPDIRAKQYSKKEFGATILLVGLHSKPNLMWSVGSAENKADKNDTSILSFIM